MMTLRVSTHSFQTIYLYADATPSRNQEQPLQRFLHIYIFYISLKSQTTLNISKLWITTVFSSVSVPKLQGIFSLDILCSFVNIMAQSSVLGVYSEIETI